MRSKNTNKILVTLTFLLCSTPAFAHNSVSYISEEAVAVILGLLILIVGSYIAALVISAGNMKRKSRSRRKWSIALNLPVTIIGFVMFAFAPGVGLATLAFTIPIWIMIFKSLPEDVV